MKTLGRGSITSILRMVLGGAWYLGWALLAFASLVLVAAAAAFLMDILGYSPGPASQVFDAVQRLGWVYPFLIAEIVAAMVVIDRLRRVFATLIAGDPFVPENARHLQVIAIAIAAYQILRHLTQGAVAMILTLMDMEEPVVGGAELGLMPNVSLGAWFAVVTLLVFAEVFREGAKMRQEQKLTI